MRKFKLLKNKSKRVTINNQTYTIYPIKAIRDFGEVTKGTIGGYVNDKSCLCQYDNSWIDQDSIVINSLVSGETIIRNSELLYCFIQDYAYVKDSHIERVTIGGFSSIDNSIINRAAFSNAYIYSCNFNDKTPLSATYFNAQNEDFLNDLVYEVPGHKVHRYGNNLVLDDEKFYLDNSWEDLEAQIKNSIKRQIPEEVLEFVKNLTKKQN